MGQTQSADNLAQENQEDAKTDFYELLGVERQATDEDIKKAYRRKALDLHPDRNYGNAERATKLFAEVQAAYEVLSDPQERAWYDSHREVFLRGSQSGQNGPEESPYGSRMTTADEVLKMTMKYHGRLEYNDASTGFYGGLRDFFARLASEEETACQWDNVEPVDYPGFGLRNDDYHATVRPFYAAWNGFTTRKSYAWKDKYRLHDASDRRVRRLMEKENKALREAAIQEYNDAVRSLVAFVRKRDPRYQDNQRSEAERQRILRETAVAQSARSRAARQAKLEELEAQTVPGWAKTQSLDHDEFEGGFSSDGNSEQHEIECVICNKKFKSEAQYSAHEKSKKHIKLFKQMQRDMVQQDRQINEIVPQHTQLTETESKASENSRDQQAGQDDKSRRKLEKSTFGRNHDTEASAVEDSMEEDNSDVIESQDGDQSTLSEETTVTEYLRATSLQDAQSDSTAPVAEQRPPVKLGKAKQKKAKKAAREEAVTTNGGAGVDLRCAVCQAPFPSKTKLFNHIKEQGHAVPVATANGTAKKGRRK